MIELGVVLDEVFEAFDNLLVEIAQRHISVAFFLLLLGQLSRLILEYLVVPEREAD